ncbi:MEDS domain-containing protein [bacterium]|nr:MEDS domain-containing protein [bacterium]
MNPINQDHLTDMGFTAERFPAGTHMCLIYSDESERRKIIGKFLESGLLAREKVAYFADTLKPEEVRAWLQEMGIALPEQDGFAITAAAKTYCPSAEFVPETMLQTLREYYRQAKQAGYPNVRVSGEMSWALKDIPGSDRLMEYEALLNEVFVTHPITAICQYDANRFSGATILDVLKVHPMMVVRGQIVQNPYYMKPQDFLKDFYSRS